MIYLPLPFCRKKRFWKNEVDHNLPPYFCKKRQKHQKNICENMVEGYDLPTPPILQKEAFSAKYGGRL